jgi:2-polyprenyl-3-methyl-5-hydroxy-6-metoxy-1,4-benzoquinol methylase
MAASRTGLGGHLTCVQDHDDNEKTKETKIDLLDAQKEYYDQRWGREQFANMLQASRCAAIIGAIAKFEVKEPRILDFGCGTGWLSAILGQFGPTTGVDLSDYAIRLASERFPWVKFYAANVIDWRERSDLEKFDIVVSQEVIEHVPDQMKYLQTAADLLKNGGHLVLTTPNDRTFSAMPGELRRRWSDQPFEDLLASKRLKQMLRPLFHILECTTIIPGFGIERMYRVVNSHKLGRVLTTLRLQQTFERACLRAGFGLHTFVVARRR